MWTSRRKAEVERRIHEVERSIAEAREVRAAAERQASAWDVIIARRAHDGLGVDLELSFTPRKKSNDDVS